MAKIGATPGGGVQRLTLSDEDKQARDLFIKWLKELDLEISVDEMGNIFGKRAGKSNDLTPVMSGSSSSPGSWALRYWPKMRDNKKANRKARMVPPFHFYPSFYSKCSEQAV